MTQETYERASVLADYLSDAHKLKLALGDKKVAEIRLVGGDTTYIHSRLLGADLVMVIKEGLDNLVKVRQQEFDSL